MFLLVWRDVLSDGQLQDWCSIIISQSTNLRCNKNLIRILGPWHVTCLHMPVDIVVAPVPITMMIFGRSEKWLGVTTLKCWDQMACSNHKRRVKEAKMIRFTTDKANTIEPLGCPACGQGCPTGYLYGSVKIFPCPKLHIRMQIKMPQNLAIY